MANIIFMTIYFCLLLGWTWAQTNSNCPCVIGKGKFLSCKEKNPDLVWRPHYNEDVQLYGDCLPQVEENTMKCFRWRIADMCGPNSDTVKCALRHRTKLDSRLTVNTDSTTVTMISPGFNRSHPHGSYYNRNLCIYNISLNCKDENVKLEPHFVTTYLSDADTCLDYLSFHINSQREPLMKFCGTDVMNRRKYRNVPSSSFYGILWSNDNMYQKGKFQIQATCEELPGSGDTDILLTPETI